MECTERKAAAGTGLPAARGPRKQPAAPAGRPSGGRLQFGVSVHLYQTAAASRPAANRLSASSGQRIALPRKDFASCGTRAGALPRRPARFLKKSGQKTFFGAYICSWSILPVLPIGVKSMEEGGGFGAGGGRRFRRRVPRPFRCWPPRPAASYGGPAYPG